MTKLWTDAKTQLSGKGSNAGKGERKGKEREENDNSKVNDLKVKPYSKGGGESCTN